MDTLIQSLQAEWTRVVELSPRILIAIVVFLGFYAAGAGIARAVRVVLRRTQASERHLALVRRLSLLVASLLGLTAAFHILGFTAIGTSVLATGGVVAVVPGFAFREIGENSLAGVFLSFDRSFEVADLIQSDGMIGTVRSIERRNVRIRTADGCDVFIPSSQLFKNALFNYPRDGLRRGEFVVGIDYADDPSKARETLLVRLAESTLILNDSPFAVEISGFTPQYVELTVQFWTDTFSADVSLPRLRTILMSQCRAALKANGFTFSSDVSTSVALAPVDVRLDRSS